MEYRFLGGTGIKVSVISYGNWLNSHSADSAQRTVEIVRKAYDLGINFFDTAEVYGYGEAEKQLGAAIKALNVPRENLVVSTKLYWGEPNARVNRIGLSRKHIIEGLKASLQRLGLDYVDIVFCHRFDPETPVEETCAAFDTLIKQGLTHYWGTSEWAAQNIFEAMMVCAEKGYAKPVVEQPQYNMIYRDVFERDYGRLFDLYKMGSTVWSPLCGGILTGKYNDGNIPQDSRFEGMKDNAFLKMIWNRYFAPEKKDKLIEILKGLEDISKELNISQAQLAMAWVISNKDVSTAITGATKPEQLEDIIKSIAIYKTIKPEIFERIEKLLGNRPEYGMNFKAQKPEVPRR